MNDKLSALIDGDLDEFSVRRMVDQLNRDDDLRKDWDIYCLIGDVIRDEEVGSHDLVSRVMAGLEEEPTVLAPNSRNAATTRSSVWTSLLPVAASVMGVAAVGLIAATMYSGDAGVQNLAGAQRVVVSQPVQPVSAQGGSGELAHREYLFVHQAMTGGGPMPGASQYVRTVSAQFEESTR